MKKSRSNKQIIRIDNSSKIKIGNINTYFGEGDDEENPVSQKSQETNNVSEFIAKGNTKKALEVLMKEFQPSSETYKTAILLLNRLNRVNTEKRLGVISNVDRNEEINKINAAILEVLNL